MSLMAPLVAFHGSDVLAIAGVVLLWVVLAAVRRRIVRRNRRDGARG